MNVKHTHVVLNQDADGYYCYLTQILEARRGAEFCTGSYVHKRTAVDSAREFCNKMDWHPNWREMEDLT